MSEIGYEPKEIVRTTPANKVASHSNGEKKMSGEKANAETEATYNVAVVFEKGHANSAPIVNGQEDEIKSIHTISSEPQSLAIEEDFTAVEDVAEEEFTVAEEAPSVQPGAMAARIESTDASNDAKSSSSSNRAPGKFAPVPKSFKMMTIPELHDKIKELNAHVRNYGLSFNRYRRALGQALDEMRTRIKEAGGRLVIEDGGPALNWEEYCLSIGVNRRSAFNWAENSRTSRDAPSNLSEAAAHADIDLLQPRTAKILRAINEELKGRIPAESELEAMLARLDPPDEPKPATAKSSKRKSGNKRRKPKLPLVASQPVPVKSVVELRSICLQFLNDHPEQKTEEPFLFAFAQQSPRVPVDEVFRPVILNYGRFFPAAERRNIYASISNVAAALADTEPGALEEEVNPPSASEPSVAPIAANGSALSELNAVSLSGPVAKPPAKPRRKLLLDFDDEHDVLQDSTVAGERKPVVSEVATDEVSVSAVS